MKNKHGFVLFGVWECSFFTKNLKVPTSVEFVLLWSTYAKYIKNVIWMQKMIEFYKNEKFT